MTLFIRLDERQYVSTDENKKYGNKFLYFDGRQ